MTTTTEERKAAIAAAIATLSPGQHVRVDAFGKLREGTVVKVNRTRAVITYKRNLQGLEVAKPFDARDIYPLPLTGAECSDCWGFKGPHRHPMRLTGETNPYLTFAATAR